MAQSLPPIVFEPALRGVRSVRYTKHFQAKKTLCNVNLYGNVAGNIPVMFGKRKQVTLSLGTNADSLNEVEVLREKLNKRIESLFVEKGNAVPTTQAHPESPATSSSALCAGASDERWEICLAWALTP